MQYYMHNHYYRISDVMILAGKDPQFNIIGVSNRFAITMVNNNYSITINNTVRNQ